MGTIEIEVHRMGQYKKGEARPMRIKSKSKNVIDEILEQMWKLNQLQDYENILIQKDLNEERKCWKSCKMKLREEQERREKFFWSVRHESQSGS